MKKLLAAALCLPIVSPAQDMLAVGYARYVYSLDSANGQATLAGIGLLGQGGLARDGAGTLWSTGYTADYEYDENGNRTKRTVGATVEGDC